MNTLNRLPDMTSFAREMIEFQNDNFGKDLEALHTKLKNIVLDTNFNYKDIDKIKTLQDIVDLVYTRLGLKIKFITNSAPAAVLPFYPNPNHVFLDKMFKGDFFIPDQKNLIKKSDGKKGYVDLQKAKVSGLFSEYEVKVYMNYSTLFKTMKLSAAEATAVLLHELGHAFYSCAYSDRIDTTNQLMSDIAHNLTGKKDLSVDIVYKELSKINPNVTEAEIEEIVNGTRIIAGPKMAKIVFEGFSHQLFDDTYDKTSFEALADNFASRFNYGRELVTALDKLGENFGYPELNSSVRFFFIFAQIFSLVALTTYLLAIFSISIPGILITGLFILLTIYSNGEKGKDYTYDDLRIRYSRIRQDAINRIKMLLEKDDGSSKKELKDLTVIIDSVDKSIARIKDFNLMFYNLSNFIFPGNRKARNSVKEQQLLEQLASNELFFKAATLKAIS